MKESRTYPLRLPRSLKEAVKRLSREDGTSINQFVATAVDEKVSALQTARFFADRKIRARSHLQRRRLPVCCCSLLGRTRSADGALEGAGRQTDSCVRVVDEKGIRREAAGGA